MKMRLVFGHVALLNGPPGAGKTLIAKSLPGIPPHMFIDEALEANKIHGAVDMLPADRPLIRHLSIRAPHHPISYSGSHSTKSGYSGKV